MSKLTITLSITLLSLFIVSCSKEESKEEKGISGNYKFISMEAHILSSSQTASGQDDEKSVTKTDYITKDNTGTILFGGGNLASTNLSYSIDSVTKTYFYSNNVLTDSLEMPFQMTVPSSSGVTTYKMVTSDSINLNSGFISLGGTTQQTAAQGMKIKTEGNMLYLSSNINQTTSQIVQGVTVNMLVRASQKITLQKM